MVLSDYVESWYRCTPTCVWIERLVTKTLTDLLHFALLRFAFQDYRNRGSHATTALLKCFKFVCELCGIGFRNDIQYVTRAELVLSFESLYCGHDHIFSDELHATLFPRELRAAFFDEGLHAFFLIFSGKE